MGASEAYADEGTDLLDYGYTLPAGMRLVLPLAPRAEAYEVTIAADGRTHQRQWDLTEDAITAVRVSGGDDEGTSSETIPSLWDVPALMSVDSRFHHVDNEDNIPHALTVTMRRVGRLVFAARYNLAIGESVELNVPLPADGVVDLTASTEEGPTVAVTWDGCPPAGNLVVAIDDRGELRAYSDREGVVGAHRW